MCAPRAHAWLHSLSVLRANRPTGQIVGNALPYNNAFSSQPADENAAG